MSDIQYAIRAKYCIAAPPFWQNTLHILSGAKIDQQKDEKKIFAHQFINKQNIKIKKIEQVFLIWRINA